MARTPRPTTDDLDASDALVNGDMGAAWNEVVARLQEELPGEITRDNIKRGWTGGRAMAQIQGVETAPDDVTEKQLNLALVTMEENSDPQGIGGSFRNTWFCTVYVIGDLARTSQQRITMTRRGELVKAILNCFISGCRDANGARVWRSLTPTGLSLANNVGLKISIVAVTFTIVGSNA